MALARRFTNIAMVAFIDLLGYSARVSTIASEDDLRAIEADVRKVQQWFDHRTADRDVREIQKLQAKQILAFSDCLVVAVPSFSELAGSEGDFDVQLSEIVSLAYAQGMCALNGIFVRGGVDYGLWHKRRDTIISPAMVEAYNLERCAIVPMIAIGEDLLKHFQDHPHRDFYHTESDPVSRYFRKFRLPDGREQWMLDYLDLTLGEIDGHLMPAELAQYREEDTAGRERLRDAAWQRAVTMTIELHKERIASAHAQATTEKVRVKYEWLATYHDDVVSRIVPHPPENLLIGHLN
jgi:hypothetical protein